MYVLFLTHRVFQDRMAPQDPKEFQAVMEPKYETIQTCISCLFSSKTFKRANKHKLFFFARVKEDS